MTHIVPRSYIRAKAARHHAAGLPRDAHGMNWHADALPTWLHEFDRLEAAKTSPASHAAPAGRGRVEVGQRCAP